MAFRELVERHKRRVYYLALDLTGNHHDAEDLSQEVFIKAYRALDRFRGDAQLQTWLYRITVNTYLNMRRKKALLFMKLRDSFADTRLEPEDGAAPGDTGAEKRVVQQHIERAMKALSPKERSAFVLRHYHDLSLKDVAEAMEVAEGTVKSLLFRAVQKLRKELAFYREELGL
jgi:RNA polymerase sigma-70 factor (ECF subfamily)